MRKSILHPTLKELTIITLGLIGTVGCFLATFSMPLSWPLFLLVLGSVSLFVYGAYGKRNQKRIWIGLAIIYGGICILTFSLWSKGLLTIMNVILSKYESNSQFTFQHFSVPWNASEARLPLTLTLCLIFIPVAILIIRTIRCKHSYFLAFFVSVPFLFAILIFTLRPDPWYLLCLIMYYFSLYGMAHAGGKQIQKRSVSPQLHSGFTLGIIVLVVMLGLRFFFPENTYIRSKRVEQTRVSIQTKIRDLLQGVETPEPGKMNLRTAGNRMYLFTDDLEVQMETPQDLYLHGYSASTYEDNMWLQVDKDTFDRAYDWNLNRYVHPFAFIRTAASSARLDESKLLPVTITNLHADDTYDYVPYHTNEAFNHNQLFQDAYIQGSEEDTQTYHIWDEQELSKLPLSDEVATYRKALYTTYTQVPDNLKHTLSQVRIANLSQSQGELQKIEAIQAYISTFGTYTLSPGVTPSNQDFITYFLTENRKGYCVHYASAAVMLLRYYGVPARYASGYRVSESDFKGNLAKVRDNKAHAWVEILDQKLGWTVLEVTPSTSQHDTPSQDALDPTPNQGNNQGNSQAQNPTDPTPNEQTPQNSEQAQPENQTKETSFYLDDRFWMVLGILILLTILPARRLYLKHRWNKRMHQDNPRLAILACGSYLRAWKAVESELEKSSQSILQEAQYSDHTMTTQQMHTILKECTRIKNEKLATLSLRQRIYYRWIKGLC